jgi:hypothetical protein
MSLLLLFQGEAGGGGDPVIIDTTTLPDADVGVAYSETILASGGATPYSFAVTTGALPTGLSLNASTGEITGTPTTPGLVNFTITVTDDNSETDDQALSIDVIPATLAITTTSLPNWFDGVPYSQTVEATGGVAPYTFSVTVGSLPNGLSLTGASGLISGTPTVQATFNFTIRVTDDAAVTDDQAFSITISELPETGQRPRPSHGRWAYRVNTKIRR